MTPNPYNAWEPQAWTEFAPGPDVIAVTEETPPPPRRRVGFWPPEED